MAGALAGGALLAAAGATAPSWHPNGTGRQGGHAVGAYDAGAGQPATWNWVRQSPHLGPDGAVRRWSCQVHVERVAAGTDHAPDVAAGRGGVVYAGVPGTDGGRLTALSGSGEVLWTVPFGPGRGSMTDLDVGPPVLASDGTALVQSVRALLAVGADGAVRWRREADLGLGPFHGSPALGPAGEVYAFGPRRGLLALDGEGRTLWAREDLRLEGSPVLGARGALHVLAREARDGGVTVLRTLDRITGRDLGSVDLGHEHAYGTSAPVVDRLGRVLVAEPSRGRPAVTGLRLLGARGEALWRIEVPGTGRGGPVLGADGAGVLATEREVRAVSLEDGSTLWRTEAPERAGVLDSTPLLDRDGNLYLAGRLGVVWSLDARGRLRWRLDLPWRMNPGAPALAADGTLLVGTRERALDGSERFHVEALGGPDGGRVGHAQPSAPPRVP